MFSLPGRSTSRCDYSDPIRDQYLIYTDKVLDAFSESTCRQACTQERDFNCRSYSFLSEVSRDYLMKPRPWVFFYAGWMMKKRDYVIYFTKTIECSELDLFHPFVWKRKAYSFVEKQFWQTQAFFSHREMRKTCANFQNRKITL